MRSIYPHSITIRATPYARKPRVWVWWLVIILVAFGLAGMEFMQ